jgi:hypothetical protein
MLFSSKFMDCEIYAILRMAPTRYDFFLADRKNGVCSSSSAVGLKFGQDTKEEDRRATDRFDGSFTKQLSTTSLNARVYLYAPPSRSRVGGSSCKLREC